MDDLDFILQLESDPDVRQFSSFQEHPTKSQYIAFLKNLPLLERDGQQRWIIEHEATPVGTVDCYDYDEITRSCGIGIIIYPKQIRRLGLGSMVMEEALHMLFTRGLHRIFAEIPDWNSSSLEFFRKLHFQIKPSMQDEYESNGKVTVVNYLILEKSVWQKERKLPLPLKA